jgi:hypothetical protein
VRECGAALGKDLLTVRHEEQPVTGQLTAQACVVDSCHHCLARTGCRNEKVAVPSASSCQFYLLQQPFLKRHENDLDRAQLKRLLRLGERGAAAELVAVERDEVAARPVRVKDGGHFRDDYPDKDAAFGKVNVVVRKDSASGMQVSRVPIPKMPAELQQVIEEMK